tara:strand:+ start:1468 stop:1740 length:273 start_codon:yes stop_codon:yes gene_type:complete
MSWIWTDATVFWLLSIVCRNAFWAVSLDAHVVGVAVAYSVDYSRDVLTTCVVGFITFYYNAAFSPLRRTSCLKIPARTLAVAAHILAAQG